MVIPAWAGNTRLGEARTLHHAVHPRVGGEHAECARKGVWNAGSSPRGRGTLTSVTPSMGSLRFIPAWAGNTGCFRRTRTCISVHPRVGGEHTRSVAAASHCNGSSPRGRGTPSPSRHRRRQRRFIPAWAGNTPTRRGLTRCSTVHPRVGGEHMRSMSRRSSMPGSSPRGRGTHFERLGNRRFHRFIPAWAGNTW